MTKIIDRATIDFLLFDVLRVSELCGQGRFADHDVTSLKAVLDLAERLAEEDMWTHFALSDRHEPYLENGKVRILPEAIAAIGKLREAGFFAAHADYELGGMQLPVSVNHACNGMFKGANVSTHAYMSLTRAAANLLNAHGSDEQKRLFMQQMLDGRFFGTMCLSEPEAGSSLIDIRTMAKPLGDGRYALKGSKMWISAGDHDAAENIIHLVLARTPDAPAGVKGISLFAVPKIRVDPDGRLGQDNCVVTAGLNHKMGYRGASNCLLAFGETGTTVGHLVGEKHRGLSYMFHMMNEARIGVGIGGAMLASVAYRIAIDYAKDRRQGRALGEKNPAAKPVPIIRHPDVRRMLLRQKVYSEGAVALCLYAGMLVDRQALTADAAERTRLGDLLDVLTPIVKAWSSEFGVRSNELAIQVLGGYGYTRDFPVEQLYRDNRLNMIHEGTNGIQALDLLGRKSVMHEGRAFAALTDEIGKTVQKASESDDFRSYAEKLAALVSRAQCRVEGVRDTLEGGSPEVALAFATPFLNAVGHGVVAWLWLEQAIAAKALIRRANGDGDTEFLAGKIAACRYFFDQELPEAMAWLEQASGNPDVLTTVAEDSL